MYMFWDKKKMSINIYFPISFMSLLLQRGSCDLTYSFLYHSAPASCSLYAVLSKGHRGARHRKSETEKDTAQAEPRQDKDKLVHTKSILAYQKKFSTNYVTDGIGEGV